MRQMGSLMRAVLGFVAGAIAVLVFHQGSWAILHAIGWMPPAPYPMGPTQPWGVPLTLSFCFWGGVYGAAYGLVQPKLAMPGWLSGLILGLVATLVLWFVVFPLKGRPVGGGWALQGVVNTLIIHGVWGIGVGLVLPLLAVRAPQRA